MLLKTVTNTLTNLLSSPAAANQPATAAQTAAATQPNAALEAGNNAPEQDNGGVKFDFSDKALEAAANSAAPASAVIAQSVTAPATDVQTQQPAATAEANMVKAASPRAYAGTVVAQEKLVTDAPALAETAETDPSEEARARAHAEQQLETSRLRNLAIGGYQDSRKLFDVIATDIKAAESKAEAAPLRQALTAA